MLNKYITSSLQQMKETGFLSVLYALLVEGLILGYLMFIPLFTLETLLPTFVSVRLNLSVFFSVLILLTFLAAGIGRFLGIEYSWNIHRKHPLLWLGVFWTIGILSISLYKFPLFLLPLLVIGFLLAGYLFLRIFFSEEE